MISPPTPPEATLRPRRPRRRRQLLFILAVGTIAAVAGGAWWAWIFIQEKLAPLVAENLGKEIDRPVTIGKLQRASLTSMRFGRSELRATPTDPNHVAVEAVEVKFDPWQLLWQRRLGLDITLVRPEVYAEQNKEGLWVTIKPKPAAPKGAIDIQLDRLQLQDAQLELLGQAKAIQPAPKTPPKRLPVRLQKINGYVNFLDNNRRFAYYLRGDSIAKGTFRIRGESKRVTDDDLLSKLNIESDDFLASEVDRLIRLPVDIQAGRLDSKIDVTLNPDLTFDLQGRAKLKQVTLTAPGTPKPINQVNGDIDLENTAVRLKKIKGKFGQIPFVANGTIDPDKGFNLDAELVQVAIPLFLKTFDVKTPIPVTGEASATVKLTGPAATPIISGTVRNTRLVTVDRLAIDKAFSNFRLDTATKKLQLDNLAVTPKIGGSITGSGTIGLDIPQLINLALQVRDVPGDLVAKVYGAPELPVAIGNVNAAVNVTGEVDRAVTIARWSAPKNAATGEVVVRENGQQIDLRQFQASLYGASVTATGSLRNQQQLQGDVQISRLSLTQFNPQLNGAASGHVKLRGNLQPSGLQNLAADGQIQAQTSGGTIDITSQLVDRSWQAAVQFAGIALTPLNPELRGAATGNFQLRGNLDRPSLNALVADGQVNLSEGVALITRPIVAQVGWDGRQINLKSAEAEGFRASGVMFAQTGETGGTPAITGIDLQVRTIGLPLAALPLQLPAMVQVAGTADFQGRVVGNPAQPQVNGQVGLNNFALNRIAFEPLQGSVNFNPGKGLQLDLQGPQHRLALQLNARNEPVAIAVRRDELAVTGQAVGPLFNIALEQIPLDQLVGLGSNFGYEVDARSLGVAGKLSANAVLNLARMEVPQATIVLNQAQIGTFPIAFQSPQIQAQISYVNGIGKSTVRLNRPRFGTVETTDAVTNLVYANQVLRIADFTVQKDQSRLSLSGNLDLRTVPRLDGEVKVAQGKIEDILSAFQIFDFSDLGRGVNLPKYGNAAGLGNMGNISIGMPTQSNVSLKTQLERLAEVNTQIKQLAQNRMSLVKPIRGTDQVNPILPDRLDIEGLFDSKIRFSTSPQGIAQGINLDEFELTAKRIEWRPFASYPKFEKSEGKERLIQQKNQKLEAQSILISGSYKDGQLNLTRADAAIGEGKIEAQLNYGGEFTSGFFKLKRLPITEIKRFYPFPLLLVGEINATANFGGTKLDPNAIGFIDLKEGGINGTPITSASGSFGYQKGRLKLDTSLQIDNPEPLTLTGYIPVQLPFLKLDESNNDIDLKINVRNQGLALINLLNAPIVWQKGEGEVNLTIGGKLSQPTANGLISLKNASFLAPGLPEPLTNVNGTIRFDQDQVLVEGLQGEFSRGNIVAKGSLPLFTARTDRRSDRPANSSCLNPEINQPLSVEMNRIALSYKGLYRGNVRGCMNVAGNAVKPLLSGEITLSEGKVLLADEVPASEPIGTGGGETNNGLTFDDLKLTLGDGIQIVRAPILNFVAKGTLTLKGNLNAPQPEGRIVLKSGQVNLFTTQFVLIRNYAHTAIFKPEQGLDPTLDVRMITAVPEIRRSSVARPSNSINSEVDDSPLFAAGIGSLQTVRIQAKVSGVASQLFENLDLSSSPSRGRNEIIGLLGGGFINTLGRGDSTLGIANLAGSALLTNIQGLVGNTLGLSEFRLFPTIATDAERRSSTLGLAAEVGFDITPGLSTSVLKILTSKQSAQFGLRYRINDRLLFRGSTDFAGDDRAALEYEVRF